MRRLVILQNLVYGIESNKVVLSQECKTCFQLFEVGLLDFSFLFNKLESFNYSCHVYSILVNCEQLAVILSSSSFFQCICQRCKVAVAELCSGIIRART